MPMVGYLSTALALRARHAYLACIGPWSKNLEVRDVAAELRTQQLSNGEWSFEFLSSDGLVLASGEGYPTEECMKRGIAEAEAALHHTRAD